MSVFTATILSDGTEMDPGYALLSVDVSKELNRIPRAQITLVDGAASGQGFPISDAAFFEPGKEIEVRLRYEGASDVTVFKGLVVRHGVEAGVSGSVLTVEMKDAAVKLTHPRRSAVFRELSDADVLGRIIEDQGLTKGAIEATEPTHPEIVQYYCSDWDFMLSRAEMQGLVASVEDGEVSLRKPDLAGEPAHSFEFGLSEIYDFEIEADASRQPSAVESVAWDIKNQRLTDASRAADFTLAQGNLDGASIAEAVGFDTCTLSHPVPLAPEEIQSWADARLAKSRLAMIRGRVSVPGLAEIKPLELIEVAGIGERFNGKTLVTGVRHRVSEEGWRTDVQFGLTPELFSRQPDIQDAPAAGLLPAVNGLQIGLVDQFEEDPEEEFRVKVLLPAIDQSEGIVWARLASPDAGQDRGFFFRPEIGDEVVVGFFNNDPRYPVILGALYSSVNSPQGDFSELSEDNVNKGIVTKKGTKIAFVDDEKASVFIETPEGNRILLDDDSQMIELQDQHGNTLTMDSNGVEIKSGGDLKIEASGNVEIKGQKVDVK